MKKYTLTQAIATISAKYGKTVTAIQFEDGSGRCFNVQLDCGPWKFIRL